MNRRQWEFPVALCVLAVYVALYLGTGEGWILPRKIALMAQLSPWLTGVTSLLIALCTFLLLTALSGRWYCRVLCPAGAVQEIFSRIGGKLRLRRLRYIPAKGKVLLPALYCFLFIMGIAPFFLQLIDPVAMFGKSAIPHAWVLPALVALILIIVPLFMGRRFCDRICPMGVLLGVTASVWNKRPVLDINTEKCVSCGKCASVCPVCCVDPAGKTIGTNRCLECGECVSACTFGAIEALPRASAPEDRRAFLRSTADVGTACAAGAILLSRPLSALTAREFQPPLITPPGTGGDKRHRQYCIACMACTAACPMGIIQIKEPRDLRPVLDYDKGFCHYNCRACLDSCPAGAFDSRLTLEERQRIRVARVTLDLPQCVVLLNNTGCGACAEVCPTHALQMIAQKDATGAPDPTKPTIPDFDPAYCIGCGACYHACPAEPRAFIVQGLAKHETAQGIRPSIAPEVEAPAHTLPEPGDFTDFPF